MAVMIKKKITIDDLGRMVNGGFDETNEHIASFEKWTTHRFGLVDAELKAIRKQLTGVVYRHEFETLESRVKDLENLFAVASKRR